MFYQKHVPISIFKPQITYAQKFGVLYGRVVLLYDSPRSMNLMPLIAQIRRRLTYRRLRRGCKTRTVRVIIVTQICNNIKVI